MLVTELACSLGAPLGPPQKVAGSLWIYMREYEHAKIHADLSNHSATRVVFASC